MKTNMAILRFAILLVCLNALSSTSALAQPAPPRNVRVTSQLLNVRSGPGLKFAIVKIVHVKKAGDAHRLNKEPLGLRDVSDDPANLTERGSK